MANRLADSTSPYLQQHAGNPVDWWEWSEEAFAEARRRDVPVFISVGYSACHWCHVMAHESFEDEAIAQLLNDNFVSIKVDREERPDVDSVYMDATVALTGHGGWPMSVFADADGRPFYAGTYFPPQPRHGMPSFPQLLTAITESWRDRRDEVAGAAERITKALEQRERAVASEGTPPSATDLDAAVAALHQSYDVTRGGFGRAPKFPPSMVLEFLLRHAARTGKPARGGSADPQGPSDSLPMVQGTCEAMARGGMYDQLGGGFARYSVDDSWVVPHFEKMLYDNALLLRVYLHWWRATGDPLAERIVRETAEFLLRDMRTPEGGFAAAWDADSEGVEGKFYAWTPQQLIDVLGEDDGRWAAALLEVTPAGTFEHGASTLQMLRDPGDAERWARLRRQLFDARALRVPPGRDDKVVAAWNGLAIAALAEAGALLDEPEWVDAARGAADLLLAVHLGAGQPDRDGVTGPPGQDGDRLVRTSRDGRAGSTDAVLEDYADVAEGFLALYAVTGEEEWLAFAGILLDVVLAHFSDGEGGFFDTADDAEQLVLRPRDPADNATPSGWLAAAQALLTYAAYTGVTEHRVAAERALAIVTALAARAPRGVGWGLAAAEALIDGPREVAVVGPADDPRTRELHRVALMGTAPGLVVAVGPPAEPTLSGRTDVPLLRDRPLVGDSPAAYVCRQFTCDAPVTTEEALAARVGARGRPTSD
ncbi:MAG: thioredoxin domain-containing protein [Actinobacteria bacterium]|nr:thioredoxin domain-containing protein [Actinomycetota bacterium]